MTLRTQESTVLIMLIQEDTSTCTKGYKQNRPKGERQRTRSKRAPNPCPFPMESGRITLPAHQWVTTCRVLPGKLTELRCPEFLSGMTN